MSKSVLSIFFILSLICVFSSCQKSETARTYSEVVTEARKTMPVISGVVDPHAGHAHDAMIDTGEGADPHAGFTKEQLSQILQESMPESSVFDRPIFWTVPTSWQEQSASGMRLATFIEKNDPTAIDCSIIVLGGSAGGLRPNIVRWLGQLNIPTLADQELTDFINQQKRIPLADQLSALIIDFTSLQSNEPDTIPSMIAAFIETADQQIFVKMTGRKQKIHEHTPAFHQLIESLTLSK